MRVSTWCLGIGLALIGASAAYGSEGVRVLIRGAEGTTFSADWTLVPADGGADREGRWEGMVPQAYTLPPGQLLLTLTQVSASGHLEVTVKAGGNRSQSVTSGEGSQIRLSVR